MYRDWLIEQGVEPEDILVINFEDFANDRLRDAQAFHDFVTKRTSVSARGRGPGAGPVGARHQLTARAWGHAESRRLRVPRQRFCLVRR
ncbi:hypothetical protein [Corynebacterium phoceense]|uniref:hypothetical protein n=1 Tax=Corynebacterium phoceense TaxID=1686286 RepID=UPI001DB2FA53|nr:hypothetical protein [Corynebacterium phoceense]